MGASRFTRNVFFFFFLLLHTLHPHAYVCLICSNSRMFIDVKVTLQPIRRPNKIWLHLCGQFYDLISKQIKCEETRCDNRINFRSRKTKSLKSFCTFAREIHLSYVLFMFEIKRWLKMSRPARRARGHKNNLTGFLTYKERFYLLLITFPIQEDRCLYAVKKLAELRYILSEKCSPFSEEIKKTLKHFTCFKCITAKSCKTTITWKFCTFSNSFITRFKIQNVSEVNRTILKIVNTKNKTELGIKSRKRKHIYVN